MTPILASKEAPKPMPNTKHADHLRPQRDRHHASAVRYVEPKYNPATDPDLKRCACKDPNECPHT